jgi:hypothetical protein
MLCAILQQLAGAIQIRTLLTVYDTRYSTRLSGKVEYERESLTH